MAGILFAIDKVTVNVSVAPTTDVPDARVTPKLPGVGFVTIRDPTEASIWVLVESNDSTKKPVICFAYKGFTKVFTEKSILVLVV